MVEKFLAEISSSDDDLEEQKIETADFLKKFNLDSSSSEDDMIDSSSFGKTRKRKMDFKD